MLWNDQYVGFSPADLRKEYMSDKLNLFDTIKQQEKFSTFTRLMTSSGANDVISSGAFTVFVPTNEAFARIPEARINELLNEI